MISFGPISSRRLGLSLGINNIFSGKVCSYNCVYCQIGNTIKQSTERQTFYEPGKLFKDVESHLGKLDKDHIPDYLTFVANGEPTLDINLGKEIRLLKKFGIPVAVITNASLISHKSVQDDLMQADWASLKIDTVDKVVWKKINRPSARIDLETILDGIKYFSSEYKGNLYTETMLINGYNDDLGQLKKTALFISGLHHKISWLSIPTRPPALKGVKPNSEIKITRAWQIFQNNNINTDLLTGFEGTNTGFTGDAYNDILNITAVHPLREDTMGKLLENDKADRSIVESLVAKGRIKRFNYNGKIYYLRRYKI
jgi:wyosine [tRNA(Phe)-imidazoG37] synthetase (radical SAM superfamily)